MEWRFRTLKFCFLGLVIGFFGLFISIRMLNRVPPIRKLSNPAATEPNQLNLENAKPIDMDWEGAAYRLYPRANYELQGLVVAEHRADSLSDLMHKETGDQFNTRDICVVWGQLLKSGLYERLEFWHGDWTCYVRGKSADWSQVDQRELSNTHVLPKYQAIKDVLDKIEVGDEIRLSGQLVDYDFKGRPFRKTSLVRTDTGNGACEVMLVDQAKIISGPNHIWALIKRGAQYLIVVSFLGALLMMAYPVFFSS